MVNQQQQQQQRNIIIIIMKLVCQWNSYLHQRNHKRSYFYYWKNKIVMSYSSSIEAAAAAKLASAQTRLRGPNEVVTVLLFLRVTFASFTFHFYWLINAIKQTPADFLSLPNCSSCGGGSSLVDYTIYH